jgi:hypothetical protein
MRQAVGRSACVLREQCTLDRPNRRSHDEVWGESDLGKRLQHADLNCAEAQPRRRARTRQDAAETAQAARKGWFRDQRSYRLTTNQCRLGASISGTTGRATSSELSLEVGTVESQP